MDSKRRGLVALLLASSLFVSARKGYEYAADPVGEKECPPLQPELALPVDLVVAGPTAPLPWAQRGGTINDASCLNQTAVYGIVQVSSEEEIQAALDFARENNLHVSMAGVRHSMGGQAFAQGALVLDILRYNQMTLDEEQKLLTVQSGATWHDIQNFLHPTYAIKAMQSTDIFTVGGSISVNAHGMDHRAGAVGGTIRAMRVLLPDGTIERVSPEQNAELFNLVVGGYGLFGIILDVELEVTENVLYETGRQLIDYETFPALFADELAEDPTLGLFYGHLSTAPGGTFLREMILYTYHEQAGVEAPLPPLGEVSSVKLRRLVLNLSKHGTLPKHLKWMAEKHIEPHMEACTVTRNQAMRDGEACLVSRNEPMHDSVPYLKNNLKNDTDILQEYFIPRASFVPFVDGLRQIMEENDTTLLNASVRVVHQEHNTLSYAPRDMFAVVLYINQATTPDEHERMRHTTRQIIDLALSLEGTFFLPYQLHYTPDQLQQAYPMIGEFFAAKQRYDPQRLFTNTFYERYAALIEALSQ